MAAKKTTQTDSSKPAVFDLQAVEKALAQMPTREAIAEAVIVLRALGDPTRTAMIVALSGVAELCVSDLAHVCGATLHIASTHLRVLRAHGLVRQRSQGRMTYYSLADERLAAFAPSLGQWFGTQRKSLKTRSAVASCITSSIAKPKRA